MSNHDQIHDNEHDHCHKNNENHHHGHHAHDEGCSHHHHHAGHHTDGEDCSHHHEHAEQYSHHHSEVGHGHQGDHMHAHVHAHLAAEEIIESALVFSKKGALQVICPCTADEAVGQVKTTLLSVAELLAVDGDVLGHIKALLSCDAGAVSLSCTRTEEVQLHAHEGWNGEQEILSAQLSVNVLSLANTTVAFEQELDKILK